MKDYYKNTRSCIDTYNEVVERILHGTNESTNEDDEFMANFCLYLSHALIKDTGEGQMARSELSKVADIINDVII